MMKPFNRKKAVVLFVAALVAIFAIFAVSVIKTNTYNAKEHFAVFAGPELFSAEDAQTQSEVYVRAAARSSTWSKIFDLNNEGITENNYQAYT